jgi:hypothetical protein
MVDGFAVVIAASKTGHRQRRVETATTSSPAAPRQTAPDIRDTELGG